jgi:hypothetical protein
LINDCSTSTAALDHPRRDTRAAYVREQEQEQASEDELDEGGPAGMLATLLLLTAGGDVLRPIRSVQGAASGPCQEAVT